MNLFRIIRNWRMQRMMARIEYLDKYCEALYDKNGSIPYSVAMFHDVPDKRAKAAALRKKLYHLREF